MSVLIKTHNKPTHWRNIFFSKQTNKQERSENFNIFSPVAVPFLPIDW